MSTDPRTTALFRFMKARSDRYAQRIVDLREAVEGWLKYVPATFPHYTSHTIDHSDEIVLRMSQLIFAGDDHEKPVVELSGIEAYIICAAAYLHDAGMVVSDKEKQDILRSDEWKKWTTGGGGGAKRWGEIDEFRKASATKYTGDNELGICSFLADRQVRFLIAEFVRPKHHFRASQVLEQHKDHLASFSFNDPILHRTIRDVCISHGLSHHELEDRERFPDRRDVQGEMANVRFCAILLRLGDLLDMTSDRACPLLLNAASPLPADSLAHWTHYQRLTHRLVAPDKIEIVAECVSQEEHRLLRDWCDWLEKEAREAQVLIARCRRHEKWRAPDTRIEIRKAPSATYVPVDWRFELDNEAVFERLIRDVYEKPEDFIRELIQNALDATRCRMYSDLPADQRPEYPTQVPEEIRQRYTVKIGLSEVDVENDLSGEKEKRQVLTVEDPGIGMDRDVVTRFFLQVGRSYYTTDEFRNAYKFMPTSRFGVGFLSVFGSSDFVTVETFKPTSTVEPKPIRITLTGPRSYFLVEEIGRDSPGTRIDVRLKEPFKQGLLTELVESWCRRVEFPIYIDDLGERTTVVAERPEDFVGEVPDITKENAKFVLRSFPIDRPGLEGELYVLAYIEDGVEHWDRQSYAVNDYPRKQMLADGPGLATTLLCVHGITHTHLGAFPSMVSRLDYRNDFRDLTLSRRPSAPKSYWWNLIPQMQERWGEILTEHMCTAPQAQGSDGWKYRLRLQEVFRLDAFWLSAPEMIIIHVKGQSRLASFQDVMDLQEFTVVARMWPDDADGNGAGDSGDDYPPSVLDGDSPVITRRDLQAAEARFCYGFFDRRTINAVRWLGDGYLAVDWSHRQEHDRDYLGGGIQYPVRVRLPHPETVALYAHSDGGAGNLILLAMDHPITRWLQRVKQAADEGLHDLGRRQLDWAVDAVGAAAVGGGSAGYLCALRECLEQWREIPGLPDELYPPEIELTEDMFRLRPPAGHGSG